MQILQNKKLKALGLLSVAGVAGASQVSADELEVTRASERGAGSDVFTSETANETEVTKLNALIDALVSQNSSNGRMEIKGEIPATDASVQNTTTEFNKIKELVNEYNRIHDQITAQVRTYTEATGIPAEAPERKVIDASNGYQNVVAQLTEAVQQAKEIQSSNESSMIDLATNSNTQNASVRDAATKANSEIKAAAETVQHSDDGIVGNLDKIKQAAKTSAKNDGVVVDYRKTDWISTVSKDATVEKVVNARTVAEVNKHKANIIARINATANENQAEVDRSATYRDNSLLNIADINKWLQVETTRAENIQSQIDTALAPLNKVDTYTTNYKAKLQELKTYLQNPTTKGSAKSKERLIGLIDDALTKLEATRVNKTVKDELNKETTDFGDIGRENSIIKAKQREVSSRNESVVNQRLAKLLADAANVNAQFDRDVADDKKSLDTFIERVKKSSGAGAQINEAFLNSRGLYRDSDGYKSYIRSAISQTEEDVSNLAAQMKANTRPIAGNVDVTTVPSGTSAVRTSAAEYLIQSEKGFDQGFGSAMLPSKNINDFASLVGNAYANSQGYAGGAEAILNRMAGRWMGLNNFSDLPGPRDIMNQHIRTVGNNNVFMVVQKNNPVATFHLSDSYTYVDSNGVHQTTDMTLTLKATNEDGSEINPRWANVPYAGTGNVYYFFYLSVDPNTGQLTTGVSFLPTGGSRDFSSGGATGGGEATLTGSGSATVDVNALKNSATDYNGGGVSSNNTEGHYNSYRNANGQVNSSDYVGGVSNTHNSATTTIATDNSQMFPWIDAVFNQRMTGIRAQITVKVNKAGAAYAVNSPLFVGDIDDGQSLYVPNGQKLTVVKSGDVQAHASGSWTELRPTNQSSNNAHTGRTNIDSQSVLIFGKDDNPGMMSQTIAIGKGQTGYSAIDVALFAPFGVIGGANLKINPHTYNLDTFTMAKPKAVAHTEGTYRVKDVVQYISARPRGSWTPVRNDNMKLLLPKVAEPKKSEKVVASNTSLVVRGAKKDVKTSSANTLVVRRVGSDKRTSSATSLTVRSKATERRTSSATTLVVRQLTTTTNTSASGNTFVVRTNIPQAEKTPEKTNTVIPTLNGGGLNATTGVVNNQAVINVSVYADKALESTAREAIDSWVKALADKNVQMNVTLSTDKAVLDKGVTMAFLNADNETTRLTLAADSVGVANDKMYEMSKLGGLAMTTSRLTLVNADADDKYNADGSIRSGEALKRTKYIIQLNTQALSPEQRTGVLKHEMGHLFGLGHDDSDSLMTTFLDDPDYTGEISEYDKTVAAAYVLSSL